MVQQLVKAMKIFEMSHPDCIGLFCFDQSSSHQALPPDALTITKLKLNDKINKLPIRQGFYMNGDQRNMQDIVYPQALVKAGLQKRIRTILEERSLCKDSLRLNCGAKAKSIDWSVSVSCCAGNLPSQQPDFLTQSSRPELEVCARGQRGDCDYSYAQLRARVPTILDSIPVGHVRRFARGARFIEAYTRELDGKMAQFAVKKYKSHRRLPDRLDLAN
ncbi:hypothetical protein V1504DRAFT_480494 [Lipomyces starkeyi]